MRGHWWRVLRIVISQGQLSRGRTITSVDLASLGVNHG